MKAISKRRSDVPPGCVVRAIGLLFILVGLGLFVGFSGRPLLNWWNAQSWEPVPCVVLSSSVGTRSSSDGDTHSVDIRYAYDWQGQQYEGHRYNFFGGSSSGYKSKRAVVDRYPAGTSRECYVDPDNPGVAVLNRDFNGIYLLGGFGLVFVALGVLMSFVRTGAASHAAQSNSQTRFNASDAFPVPDEGTATLKGGYNSIGGFVGLLIFGTIWNVVIGFAIWDNTGLGGGRFELFPFLFLTPFILIGLTIIGGAVYFFLALFNPRPDLEMTPGYLPLGGAVVVAWRFRGNTARIRRLTITVRGQEAATYRRGTSTSTDRSVFEKIVVVETDEPALIAQGEATFAMPEFTAPSFDGPNNKIQWQVKVQGEIPRWPDVNEEFALIVHPLPLPDGTTHQSAEFHLLESGENP